MVLREGREGATKHEASDGRDEFVTAVETSGRFGRSKAFARDAKRLRWFSTPAQCSSVLGRTAIDGTLTSC